METSNLCMHPEADELVCSGRIMAVFIRRGDRTITITLCKHHVAWRPENA